MEKNIRRYIAINDALTSLVLDLNGQTKEKIEIIEEFHRRGITDIMEGPFKEWRLFSKLKNGVELGPEPKSGGYLIEVIQVQRNYRVPGKVYTFVRCGKGPLD